MQDGPTLRDVAERAGVSPITASRILNGSRTASPVAAATRKRVEAAAAKLGYRLDAVAQAMRHRRSGQIGVVVANVPGQLLTNLPAYEYILGLNAGLEPCGYVLSLVRLTDVDGGRPERVRALEERLLDGLIVLGHMPPAAVRQLRERKQRIIWLDSEVDEPTGCLRRDETAAGRDAAGLLLARGRKRLVWLQRPPEFRTHYSHVQREAGARAACAAAGAAFTTCDLDRGFACADPRGFRAILADPAVGLLLPDPTLCRRMQAVLLGLGLVPGRDLGVAACDCDAPLNDLWPELSRVEVRRDAIGLQAAGMMQELLEQNRVPDSQVIRSPVVAGETA
jgi:DNA-binding LacI/PurR family transcriptional regulator